MGNSADVTQNIIGSSVVGDIATLPAGALGFALGVEFRKDNYNERSDSDFSSEDQMGFFPFIPISGEVKLKEVFAEVLVPILSDKSFARYLAVEGGYRYTDHSLAGGFDVATVCPRSIGTSPGVPSFAIRSADTFVLSVSSRNGVITSC